jgi:hypothetical protein
MDKKQRILYIVKQFIKRSIEPTVEDKRFLKAIWLSLGSFVCSICLLLLTGLAPFFVLLMYGTLVTLIAVNVALVVWRIRDISQKMKNNI